MFVRARREPGAYSSVIFGLALAGAGISLQKFLFPFLAPDSYQLLLSAVAVSVMYGGIRAGLAALAATGLAKWFLFLPPVEPFQPGTVLELVKFALFLILGLLICWLGQKLQASNQRVKLLSGMLPVCAWCKRIQDEGGEWQPMEAYIHEHSEADFTHGLCSDCARELVN